MIRTRFEALFVRRNGEQWGSGGRTGRGLRGNPRMIGLSMAIGISAFAAACIGLGQCVFTFLLAAAALPLMAFATGRSSRSTGQTFIVADAQYLDMDHIRVRWTDVERLEHRLVGARFGEAPCIAVHTTRGMFLIGMASLPEVDQRLEELRSLHARGQGSASDVPDALRSMKRRKPERP